uniref:Charged multivesicular body protein 1a n=1 Tax=Chromera velia CCMP2878 TaxID=1169474 RepID=A0A0G4HIA2_9ALVE|mmetsp:Transcript_33965/g.67273  ORF Transcript_33965/g.67273 Transcript_33965/m.67273 type:complete len:212 (-) Transcript_33965:543-1178(-)|eukprot:Cvel_27862.t1-p1 / transcript=Cvel_27862.t1 / gene=Cvel_27862 / organism=Chromera_velia_CCMP2878 / gene_product=Charged multivesicular body protein 1, putative / transcript_product=Charged multivesicular body protein 1, putative / location=Cvel_scaffold3544:8721-11166(-) / protein_length=211 / sequence_SO=supercontig / SO=protein_coding / is_pseudo=false
MGAKPSIQDTIINMRLKSKELARMSKKCEKEEKAEKLKIKSAIEKGNKDGAQIYAQNAIRKKHEALNYLKLSSKMDAVASRIDSATRSQEMTQDIYKAVPGLQKALNSMNVESITTNMDAFEKLFEDLDVRGEYVTGAIDSTTASATPVDQVDALIQQVGDEHALDVGGMLNKVNVPNAAPDIPQQVATQQPQQGVAADALQDRLNNLRGP